MQLLKGGNKYIPQEAFLVRIEKSQASIYKMALQINNMLYILSFLTLEIGEGNGTPLQYSCRENPTDGGAW